MKVGVSIPQIGRLADPSAIRAAACAAEQVGYASVWVCDRLLAPFAPRSAYPADARGRLPEEMKVSLDPLGVLTLAAAVTERVRLGTSVLVAPWYSPLVLARALTTLDNISAGRLTVGLGVGWSVDEYEAAGVPMSDLGARLDETLDVLDVAWGDDVASYRGRQVSIAESRVLPKPVQRPRPPVLLAARTPAGLDRVARRADGWHPAGLPVEAIAPTWNVVRLAATAHGRDPDSLSLVVRADIRLTDRAIEGERTSYHGSVEQVAEDLDATRRAGAHEVVLRLLGDPTLEEMLDKHARLAESLDG